MRHKIKLAAFFLAGTMILGGCSQGGQEGEKARIQTGESQKSSQDTKTKGGVGTASQTENGGEKTVIRFENHGANKHELFAEAVQIFNESQEQVYVDFQTNTQDWEASLWAALAVDDAPDIITHIAQARIPQYAEAGHLMDLTSMGCAAFIDGGAREPVSYKGGLYAIPVQTEIYGVFYNKDLFEKAGITEVPRTLSQLEEVVEALKPLEEEGIYPFSAQYRDSGQLSFYMTYGGAASLYKSVAEQGQTLEGVAEGTYTFENSRVKDIFRLYNIVGENCQPKPEDTDYTTHNTLFAAGESAMLIMGNWTIAQIRELNPEINIGMFALPVSEDPEDAVFAEDYNLVINVNAHTKNKEAVDEFLSFFCDYQKPTKEFFIKNALPSGLKNFEQVVTYDPALKAPLEAESTSEYFTRILPNGFDPGKSIQEYMLDPDMTIDEAASLLQKNYTTHIENMKK